VTPGRRVAGAAAGGAALAVLAAIGLALARRPEALDRVRDGAAAPGAGGIQTIAIVVAGGRYAPNLLRARAGAPLRLRFEVRGRDACATRVMVPDLGLDLPLPAEGVVEHVLPAAPRGAYVLTCEMRMVKGVLHLE
jgi:plastocyanin domain-containing protein